MALTFVFCGATSAEVPTNRDARGDRFVRIFDGKGFAGWRCVPPENASDWSIRDGVLVGTGSENKLVYLVYKDQRLVDFELRLQYRFLTPGNSGVEIRAQVDKTGKRPFEGYHADIGYAGIGSHILGAWDFHFACGQEHECRRGTKLLIDKEGRPQRTRLDGAVKLDDIRKRDWNRLHIFARGERMWFTINGKPASEFTDLRPERFAAGMIGLQIHDAGMVVEFKEIELKRSKANAR